MRFDATMFGGRIVGAATKGLQVAGNVKGIVHQFGGGGGGPAAAAPEAKAEAKPAKGGDKAEKGDDKKDKAKEKEEVIDRFIKQLDNPNVRSLADIKGIRDRVLNEIQKNGLDPQQADNAKKKLNHAILKKLGIAKPGADGKLEVPLTAQNKQILQALGMRPDGIKPAGGAPNAAAANGAPNGAAPKVAAPKPAAPK